MKIQSYLTNDLNFKVFRSHWHDNGFRVPSHRVNTALKDPYGTFSRYNRLQVFPRDPQPPSSPPPKTATSFHYKTFVLWLLVGPGYPGSCRSRTTSRFSVRQRPTNVLHYRNIFQIKEKPANFRYILHLPLHQNQNKSRIIGILHVWHSTIFFYLLMTENNSSLLKIYISNISLSSICVFCWFIVYVQLILVLEYWILYYQTGHQP